MKLIPKWEITRDEDHNYTVQTKDGPVILPGTTGILDIVGSEAKINGLMGWAKKTALLKACDHIREYRDKNLIVTEEWITQVYKSAWVRDREKFKEAGDKGNDLHAAINEHINGGDPLIGDEIVIGYANYLMWREWTGIKITHGDTFIASVAHGYGGAADAFGEADDLPGLVDFKSSNYTYGTHALQAGGAYLPAAEETFEMKLHWAVVVRFGKEILGDIDERWVDVDSAVPAFRAAFDLHKKMKAPLWAGGTK